MRKWTALISLLVFFILIQANASSIKLIGTIPVEISTTDLTIHALGKQTVYVQELRLSDSAQNVLKQRIDAISADGADFNLISESYLPARIDLGMNGTPVLNQGVHGSCVTFTATAALDAIIGKGDYISQLCSLELGDYLMQQGLTKYSGWNGSFGEVVLGQLQRYGIITKHYQKKTGCANVKHYPLNNEYNTGKPMSINEYSSNALSLADIASWDTLIDIEHAFTENHNPNRLLRQVKKKSWGG